MYIIISEKEFKEGVFHQVYYMTLELWKLMDGSKSADELIGQLFAYSNYKKLYEFKYVLGLFSIQSW